MTPHQPFGSSLEQATEVIANLRGEIVSLRALVESLRAENAELRAENASLKARLSSLEARLGQNSTNSSRPPSSDPPWSKPKRKPPEPPSGRKCGGQDGHVPHVREPVPREKVDEVVDVHPTRCGICGAELPLETPVEDAFEHQVTDLAQAQAVVTAYLLWRKRCPNCGGRTRAKRPAGVPEDAFGPRLKAVVTALTAKYRVSRREMVEVMRDLFGVELSTGAVQGICEEVSEAVVPAVEKIRQAVASAPSVHADETGWAQKGGRCWLWAATTPDGAFFVVAPDRGRPALSRLLPVDYAGIVHCDRWRPYELFGDRRQLCHSHLRRDFQGLIDRGGAAKPAGEQLLLASDRMFRVWHAFQRGEFDRARMVVDMEPVQDEWDEALDAAFERGDDKSAALAWDLFRQWDALWTFVTIEGVEPTNNDAERALRPVVLLRKGSFGTQSDAGGLFVGRARTIIETARRRGVRVVDWLERACRAASLGVAPPPLLSG